MRPTLLAERERDWVAGGRVAESGLVQSMKDKIMSSSLIILIIVLFLLFGGGGGYYYSRRGR